MPTEQADETLTNPNIEERRARQMADAQKKALPTIASAKVYGATDRGRIEVLLTLGREATRETPLPGASHADNKRCLIWLTEQDFVALGARAAWQDSLFIKEADKAGFRLLTFAVLLKGALTRAGVALPREDAGVAGDDSDPEVFTAGRKALGRALDRAWELFLAKVPPKDWPEHARRMKEAEITEKHTAALEKNTAALLAPAAPGGAKVKARTAKVKREQLLTFAEIVNEHDVLMPALSKAVGKPKTHPHRLPARKRGGKWYVKQSDFEAWLPGHMARREQYALRHPNGAKRADLGELARKLGK